MKKETRRHHYKKGHSKRITCHCGAFAMFVNFLNLKIYFLKMAIACICAYFIPRPKLVGYANSWENRHTYSWKRSDDMLYPYIIWKSFEAVTCLHKQESKHKNNPITIKVKWCRLMQKFDCTTMLMKTILKNVKANRIWTFRQSTNALYYVQNFWRELQVGYFRQQSLDDLHGYPYQQSWHTRA